MAKAKKQEKKTPERAKVEDIEKIVVDLGKSGMPPAKIGLVLKETYGIQKAKVLGKKIGQILKENKIEIKDELSSMESKLKNIERHFEKNKQDKRAKREISRYVSLKRKIKRYANKKRG
ncbi:MAG: hypothetical protein WC796_01840 [Candidatus Pacearchaeota archaeon]|jgi:small subunit ribosomal protein S15